MRKREQQTENPPLETPLRACKCARLGVLSRNCPCGPDAYAGPLVQHRLLCLTSGLMFGNVNFDGAGGNTFGLVTEPALSQSGLMAEGEYENGFL